MTTNIIILIASIILAFVTGYVYGFDDGDNEGFKRCKDHMNVHIMHRVEVDRTMTNGVRNK